MERIRRSWALVKASWSVLRADKELLVFPAISAVLVALAIGAIAGGFMLVTGEGAQEVADRFDETSSRSWSVGDLATLFLIYLASVAIATFFNAALTAATLKRLRGGDPTIGDGLRVATSRIGSIIGYSLIAATVGMLLQLLRGRSDSLGRAGAGILGAAWGVLTFLVVPVLVAEDVGPKQAIERSGSLLKRTWGEQLAGNFGLGLISFLAALLVGAIGVAAIWIAAAIGSTVAIGGAIALIIVLIAVVAVLFSALNAIYKAALYEFAAEGITASAYGADTLRHAFVQK